MNIPLNQTLMLGATLFVLGAVGFLTRRNLITLFLCAELMLQGVALNLVEFSAHYGHLHGQVFALFIVTVAACEAGLALALILVLYRSRKSLDVSLWQDLRDPELEPSLDTDALPTVIHADPDPILPVAGRLPVRSSTGGDHV